MPKKKAYVAPPPKYIAGVITTSSELEEVVAAYSEWPEFVFDIETVAGREQRPSKTKNLDKPALDEMTNKVIWLALACPGRVDVIPMGHPDVEGFPAPPQLDRSEVLGALRPLFFSDRRKIGHNVAFDTLSLAKYWGAVPPPPYGDTVMLLKLLNENLTDYGLGALTKRYLSYEYDKLGKEGEMDKFPFHAVAQYAGIDAKVTQLLWENKRPLFDFEGRENLARVLKLEEDVIEVLIYAKRRGALVDSKALEELDVFLTGELEKLTQDVLEHVSEQLHHPTWDPTTPKEKKLEEEDGVQLGRRFLLSSPQRKAKLLYGPVDQGGLGLSCKVFTETRAPSTSEKALKPLIRAHPVVPLLLQHAEYNKLQGTYSAGFRPHIAEDSRIRSSLKQGGATTGRFSSASPNLQNVPRQTEQAEESQRIRAMFKAPPGYVLVVGDFGQIEYRVEAHYAGPMVKKSRMLQAFLDEIDLHAMTAGGLFDLPPDRVTKEQRQQGKCHPAGTLIHTTAGVVPIESLGFARGEEEWENIDNGLEAWDGEQWRRIRQFYSDGVRPVYEIEAKADSRKPASPQAKGGMRGFRVRVTEQHQVWTRRGWVPANELVLGQDQIRVGLGRGGKFQLGLQVVPVNAFAPRHGCTTQTALQPITEDWAYLLGIITGDGCLSSNTAVSLLAGDEDGDLRATYSQVVERLGLGSPVWHREVRARGAVWKLGIGSTTLVRFIETVGVYNPLNERRDHPRGRGRKTLRIPDVIMRSPRYVAAAFLRGLFDTDGTAAASGSEVSFCSKSIDLCKDVQVLMVSMGVFCQLREKWNIKVQRSYWEVVVPARWVGTFSAEIGFRSQRKTDRIADRSPSDAPDEEWVTVQRFTHVSDELVFDIEVDESHRVVANGLCVHQTANFCLMFGGGENRLIESGLAKSPARAKTIFNGFHQTYPEVRLFSDAVIKRCRGMNSPYVETMWGRRRRLPAINAPLSTKEAGRIRGYSERQAANHIIQGTAADINKAAMVRAFRRLDRFGLKGRAHLILTVHDEIMLEVPEDHAEAGVALLKEAMEGVKVPLRVPLVADVHYGLDWASAK